MVLYDFRVDKISYQWWANSWNQRRLKLQVEQLISWLVAVLLNEREMTTTILDVKLIIIDHNWLIRDCIVLLQHVKLRDHYILP